MPGKTNSAVRFFFREAGYSYDPKTEKPLTGRWRGAYQLADAERHARTMEWSYRWEPDLEPIDYITGSDGNDDEQPDELLGCVLVNSRGEVLGSLWGIGDPSAAYRRVVEAELALEARHEIVRSMLEAV